MKSKTIVLLLAVFGTQVAKAQQAITTTGSNTSASGGTVTYTVGQIAYTTNKGNNGNIAQGVQQPYETWVVTGIDNHSIDLKLAAYPNPTVDFLTLKISNQDFSDLSFELSDLHGKLIERRTIVHEAETIRMGNLPVATYFLKVINNTKEVKTFKIIKN